MTLSNSAPRRHVRRSWWSGLLGAGLAIVALTGMAAGDPAATDPAGTDAVDAAGDPIGETTAEAHASFDPAPDLQRTPGGNLIVNAFIMQGPVRVEVREQGSDRLLLERESDTLFPFELSHRELGIEPDRVLVHIYIDGALAHQLTLREP